jgi:hypothetical protein
VVDWVRDFNGTKMSPTQAVQMIEAAVKVERLALGERTENIDQIFRDTFEDDRLFEAALEDPALMEALEKLLDATEPVPEGDS